MTLMEMGEIDPHNWTQIVEVLEKHMSEIRDTANQPLSEKDSKIIVEIEESEKLRNQVWKDYRRDREDHLCSRCGSYTKYEIIEKEIPIHKDLRDNYSYNFYHIEYELKPTHIRNKDSLGSVEWGHICTTCRDHILGKAPYPLKSSQKEAEKEIQILRKQEHKRRLFQDDEITAARKAVNKARKEDRNDEFKQERRGIEHPNINPNDTRNMEK